MIDKIRVKDSLLESEMKALDNYLDRNDLRKRQNKLLRGYHKYKWRDLGEKYKEVNEFKDRSLTQILDQVKNE